MPKEKTNIVLSTTYDDRRDTTIVWSEVYYGNTLITESIVGWYFGQPDSETTKECSKDHRTAVYDLNAIDVLPDPCEGCNKDCFFCKLATK